MKYFIDTNIFLTTFLQRDKKNKYQDCLNFFKKIEEQKIEATTSSLIFAEIIWTMKSYYKIPKSEIIKHVKSITHSGIVIKNTINDEAALEKYSKLSVKFIDTQIASIPEIKDKKWTVVSYDKDFDKLKVKRKEPGEIY